MTGFVVRSGTAPVGYSGSIPERGTMNMIGKQVVLTQDVDTLVGRTFKAGTIMTITGTQRGNRFDLAREDGSAFGKICGLSIECFRLVEQDVQNETA